MHWVLRAIIRHLMTVTLTMECGDVDFPSPSQGATKKHGNGISVSHRGSFVDPVDDKDGRKLVLCVVFTIPIGVKFLTFPFISA